MNTTEQAQQLRLAAGIIETGHPWDLKVAEKWHSSSKYISAHPLSCIFRGQKIRLALATPPDGRPLHNPYNLTAEQVGAGYRLLTQDEFQKDAHPEHQEWWSVSFQPDTWVREKPQRSRAPLANYGTTYRVPLSTPWPGWRYVEPTTKTVLLGPEDVPPFSLLRLKGYNNPWNWLSIEAVDPGFGIRVVSKDANASHKWIGWDNLDDHQINRSIPLTGKWDATAWEPCSKEVAV